MGGTIDKVAKTHFDDTGCLAGARIQIVEVSRQRQTEKIVALPHVSDLLAIEVIGLGGKIKGPREGSAQVLMNWMPICRRCV